MATDAQKKLQELIEDVRGSDSKLTVSGVKKFDDANKLKLGLFQQGLTSIKDQDPSVEARRKANFSIGNLATNFLINKAFGGEDALKDRKGFKKQRQAYQELKTEYLSSKFKDPETAELLRELAPKFEKESAIRTVQNDYNEIISVGRTFILDDNLKPLPFEKQIEALESAKTDLEDKGYAKKAQLYEDQIQYRKEKQRQADIDAVLTNENNLLIDGNRSPTEYLKRPTRENRDTIINEQPQTESGGNGLFSSIKNIFRS
tara:strand:+ start:559 stop:1338 length:780 start_codon:yes stop_codon:yes gene_type:complete